MEPVRVRVRCGRCESKIGLRPGGPTGTCPACGALLDITGVPPSEEPWWARQSRATRRHLLITGGAAIVVLVVIVIGHSGHASDTSDSVDADTRARNAALDDDSAAASQRYFRQHTQGMHAREAITKRDA